MQLTGKLRRHLCDTAEQRRESALLYYSDTVDIVPITGYEGRSWKIPADTKKPEDVLFWADDEKDTYHIYHLTYSHKEDKFLRFVEMEKIEKVKEFLERQFIDEYL